MNLVDQWFPQRKSSQDGLVEGMCLVMHFYGISKRELEELYIPEFIIMRRFAEKFLKEQWKVVRGAR